MPPEFKMRANTARNRYISTKNAIKAYKDRKLVTASPLLPSENISVSKDPQIPNATFQRQVPIILNLLYAKLDASYEQNASRTVKFDRPSIIAARIFPEQGDIESQKHFFAGFNIA